MSETKIPDHSSRGHHPFGPSTLKAVKECPGYEGEDGTSEAAEMGTRIHEALEVRDPSNLLSELEVDLYHKCVKAEDELIAEYFGDEEYERFNELPLTVPLNNGLEIWGTGDVLCVNKRRTRGLEIDYKTGRMKVDDAAVNLQAKAYKNGAWNEFPTLEELRFIFLAPQLDLIDIHDFSQYSVPIDRQEITTIVSRAKRARDAWGWGDPIVEMLNPCDHCTWCRHQSYCPAIHGLAIEFAEQSHVQFPTGVSLDTSDPAELAQLYDVVSILLPQMEAIKKRAKDAAMEGEVLPGWQVRSLGARAHTKDNSQFIELAENFGVTTEDILDLVNIPVAQVRKLIESRAPRGEKAETAKQFMATGVDTGAILKGQERLALVKDEDDS